MPEESQLAEAQAEEETEVEEVTAEDVSLEDESIGGLFDEGEEETETVEDPPADKLESETEPVVETPEPIPAPEHWSDADKATFNALPRDGQDFIIARHKAMEGDYTRKSQGIAQEREFFQGLAPLGQALQNDPAFRDHLKNYQPGTKPTEPPELDPIETLKQEVLADARKEREEERKRLQVAGVKNTIDETVQAYQKDPDYEAVMEGLVQLVKDSDEELRPMIWQKLDTDPKFYAKKFKEIKAKLSTPPPETPPKKDALPAPRTEKKIVPKLRGAGGDADTVEMNRKQKLKTIRERMASGSVTAIGDYFDAVGQ